MFLMSFSALSAACIIDPLYRTANEYQRFVDESDLVFLGKFDSAEIQNQETQLAKFTVIKTFKGNAEFGEKLIIKNMLGSSCSRVFYPEGTAFYVFASETEVGEFTIGRFASFVPMSVAIETDMGLK